MSEIHPSPKVNGRDLDEILLRHSLREEDFENKLVLDLGYGKSDLGIDLAQIGIKATVYGIDIPVVALQPYNKISSGNLRIAANINALPIASETMDIVLATYSLPFWSISVEGIHAFFKEGQRVTKVGGLFSVHPLQVDNQTSGHGGLFVTTRLITRGMESSDNWKRTGHDSGTFTAIKLS